jgi:mono/diheme cytochrome c family protein
MKWIVAVLALGACDLDLERMGEQPRFTSYEQCGSCPAGTIMMLPPEGTVARNLPLDPADPADTDDTLPAFIDRNAVERGGERFHIFCAACHGHLGDGHSQVAENMLVRRPADLLAEPYRSYPAGRLYRVVTHGYGMMRSYANELPYADRWAVVAYVQALQVSQRVALDHLSDDEQQEARRWLR